MIKLREQSPRQQHSGLTLLEILVSLIVISLGLLGVATLQTNSLKSNNEAYFYSIASFLAYEMSERIRINPTADGSYASTMTSSAGSGGSTVDCVTNQCSASEMAFYDLQQWLDNIAASLPSGAGRIVYTPGTQDGYLITIRWKPHFGGNCAADGSASSRDFSCFNLSIMVP